jgi:hypothetical protein
MQPNVRGRERGALPGSYAGMPLQLPVLCGVRLSASHQRAHRHAQRRRDRAELDEVPCAGAMLDVKVRRAWHPEHLHHFPLGVSRRFAVLTYLLSYRKAELVRFGVSRHGGEGTLPNSGFERPSHVGLTSTNRQNRSGLGGSCSGVPGALNRCYAALRGG